MHRIKTEADADSYSRLYKIRELATAYLEDETPRTARELSEDLDAIAVLAEGGMQLLRAAE